MERTIENLGSDDLESLRIKYKNYPSLHDKIAVLILEIDKNEILVQNLQSKNKFKINVENVFKSKWLTMEKNLN